MNSIGRAMHIPRAIVGRAASRSTRRWYQFSFRFLLLALLLVCLGAAWLSGRMRRAETQRRAVATIRLLGGDVRYQRPAGGWPAPPPGWLRSLLGDDFFDSVTGVTLRDQRITDDELAVLKALPKIQRLELSGTSVTGTGLDYIQNPGQLQLLDLGRCSAVTEAGLARVGRFTELRVLDLARCEAAAAGLKHLHALTRLEMLDLQDVPVTDAGLRSLGGLTCLKRLYLRGSAVRKTPVTDAGLPHLQGLVRLELLHLNHSLVSDRGLSYLIGLPRLQRVYLRGTAVSDRGRREFQQARPDVRICEQ